MLENFDFSLLESKDFKEDSVREFILSKARQHKAKNPYFKKIKKLWILRFLAKAQYDKIIQYDNVKSFWILHYAQYDNKEVSMTKVIQYDKFRV